MSAPRLSLRHSQHSFLTTALLFASSTTAPARTMAVTKRLLGVFVPTTRPVPGVEKRNKHVIPIVLAPPVSAERRAELDRGERPTYEGISDDEMKTHVRERSIGLRGRRLRAHWIKALDDASLRTEGTDRAKYETWKSNVANQIRWQRDEHVPYVLLSEEQRDHLLIKTLERLRKGQNLMFASTFKADATRATFFRLPPEIRNMIYDFSLFGEENLSIFIKLKYHSSKDKLLPFFRQHYRDPQYDEEVMLSVLNMLSAMSKQTRDEVRCYSYANMPIKFQGETSIDAYTNTYTLVHRFLTKIGAEGRASIPRLDMSLGGAWKLDFSHTGYTALNTMMLCQGLQYFNLEPAVPHIFRGDINPLKATFLHGQPLQSPGLEAFGNFITSFPRLRSVHIRLRATPKNLNTPTTASDDEKLLSFAFIGIREVALWFALDEHVQGNHALDQSEDERRKLGDVFVVMAYPTGQLRCDGDEVMVFEEWCQRCDEQRLVEGRVDEVEENGIEDE